MISTLLAGEELKDDEPLTDIGQYGPTKGSKKLKTSTKRVEGDVTKYKNLGIKKVAALEPNEGAGPGNMLVRPRKKNIPPTAGQEVGFIDNFLQAVTAKKNGKKK